MAASLRDLRRKIKSIQGTKKLTQAMQMVAASRMQKAIQAAETSRNYANLTWQIIKNIRSGTDVSQHFLLSEREAKNIAVILVTANRGLCGGLNAQIIRQATIFIKEMQQKNIKIDLITIGNKGKLFASRFYKDIFVADFPLPDQKVSYSDITSVSKMILDDYQNKKYDHVYIFYNRFISTLTQEPIKKQLLPIPSLEENDKMSDIFIDNNEDSEKKESTAHKLEKKLLNTEYKFEPDIQSVLNALLPNIIRTQLYQIMLEANASEQSARMVAMKNATDNAGDLIEDLTLTYNSLRQAAITKEISEISAGAEALRT
jgi:F-type H+-transporting ATPase subunit gamma